MVAATERTYTVAEFLALPEDLTDGCELLNGRIVKKQYWKDTENGMTPRSLNHSRTIAHATQVLGSFVDERNLGEVLTTPSFRVGFNRGQSRKPDVAFVVGTIPTEPEAVLSLVPALAIEIVSPNNTAGEIEDEDKVKEYLAAGTQLVWLMFPESRTVIAFWPDRGAVFLADDTITAEPVLPGFFPARCPTFSRRRQISRSSRYPPCYNPVIHAGSRPAAEVNRHESILLPPDALPGPARRLRRAASFRLG